MGKDMIRRFTGNFLRRCLTNYLQHIARISIPPRVCNAAKKLKDMLDDLEIKDSNSKLDTKVPGNDLEN